MPSLPHRSPADESPLKLSEVKEQLEACLSNVQRLGSFAVSGSPRQCANPGVFVNGVGSIGLPLSDRDARALVEASHEAPFGKGSETIVDVNVRKTWELNADAFELQNPAWPAELATMLQDVLQRMGIPKLGVKAELYKMLLYEEGAMFKPHQDSEKAPGMFATLVVCLPSKHEGGNVRLSHAGKHMIFQTAETSAFDCNYMAWFSDVVHEVLPVTSGRRLVLTYNIINTLGVHASASDIVKSSTRLRNIFLSWQHLYDNKKDRESSMLVYQLEHQYTQVSLHFHALKGADKQIVSTLKQTCSELGFHIYLAILERVVLGDTGEHEDGDYGYYGGYDDEPLDNFHEIVDVIEEDVKLLQVVDLAENVVANDMDVHDDNVITRGHYSDEDPQEEDYSGFTGNEGVTATHFYRHTAVVVVPRGARVSFLLDREIDSISQEARNQMDLIAKGLLHEISSENQENSSSDNSWEEFLQICDVVARNNDPSRRSNRYGLPSTAPFSSQVVEQLLRFSVQKAHLSSFMAVLLVDSTGLPFSIYSIIGEAIGVFGLEPLKPQLHLFLERMPTFSERFQAIEKIAKNRASSTEVQSWYTDQLGVTLSSADFTAPEDVDWLIIAAQDDETILSSHILSAVKKMSDKSLMLTFLVALAKRLGSISQTSKAAITDAIKDTLPTIIEQLGLQFSSNARDSYSGKRQKIGEVGHVVPEVQYHISRRHIADLLFISFSLGLEAVMDQMIAKIAEQAASVPAEILPRDFVPFLEVILDAFASQKGIYSNPHFQFLFQQLLGNYVNRYVEKEPMPPTDWSRPRRGCGCKDCKELNRFLTNPAMATCPFSMAEHRRTHLERQLDPSEYQMKTERYGSPYTLVVTKTNGGYQKVHQKWVQRRTHAQKTVMALGSDALKTLLGDLYESIIDCRGVASLNVTRVSTVDGGQADVILLD
ncbi:MAG: hypothetical protein M1818_001655 [Claussenomyces sp. TS43310]|nr:MAG: hypothetical protein M1818_001655 [Claussenomyces sp. TS43310]